MATIQTFLTGLVNLSADRHSPPCPSARRLPALVSLGRASARLGRHECRPGGRSPWLNSAEPLRILSQATPPLLIFSPSQKRKPRNGSERRRIARTCRKTSLAASEFGCCRMKFKKNSSIKHKVDERYTTKTCHRCGNMREMGGSKVYICHRPGCGYRGGRDENSAINIFIKNFDLCIESQTPSLLRREGRRVCHNEQHKDSHSNKI